MQLNPEPNMLDVYHEGRKRKIYVGRLSYSDEKKRFIFAYDAKYLRLKNAIPIGPEFPLTKQIHESNSDALFASLADRIPSKENPAYKEYCAAYALSPEETNVFTLLTTIGHRGPSTFVFEAVTLFKPEVLVAELKALQVKLEISLWELATAFDVPYLTMQRIANGKCKDMLTMRLVAIYLSCPEAALWQLKLSGKQARRDIVQKLTKAIGN